MKRLAIFDFDGTLIDSPEKEEGKKVWTENMGQPYSHKGWWGRKESLDTDVFDIKPFPKVLARLEEEKAIPDTMVIILSSRMEKLRPEIENVLDINGIVVDEVILKNGGEGKGDVILKIENYNQDLKEIVVYDDFMNKNAEKIEEYTKIKDLLLPDVKYILYYVDKGNISPLITEGVVDFKNTNYLLEIINDEIKTLNIK